MDKQMEVCMVMEKVINKSVDIVDTCRQSVIEVILQPSEGCPSQGDSQQQEGQT